MLFLIVLIILSYGWCLSINYPLWDDWVVFNQDWNIIKSQFQGNGFHYFGLTLLHKSINNVFGSIVFVRILNLIVFVLTGYIFRLILRKHFDFDDRSSDLVFLFFIILPFNTIKSFQIVLPYNLCFMFFVLGCYKYLQKKIYMAILFFIFSFITNSFLFIFFPIFLILNKFKLNVKNVFYLTLPILFFIGKNYLIKVDGLYEKVQYNKITIHGLIYGFLGIPKTIKNLLRNIYYYFNEYNSFYELFVVLLVVSLLSYFFIRKNDSINNEFRNNILLLFLISIILLISGIYPYCVVHKSPENLFYESRHQLIMPLGASLLVFSIYSYIYNRSKRIANFILGILIVISVSMNYCFQKELYINSKAQLKTFKKIETEIYNPSKSIYLKINYLNSHYESLSWRVYELGSYLNFKNKKQNVYIYGSVLPSENEIQFIKQNKYMFLKDFDDKNVVFDSLTVNYAEFR